MLLSNQPHPVFMYSSLLFLTITVSTLTSIATSYTNTSNMPRQYHLYLNKIQFVKIVSFEKLDLNDLKELDYQQQNDKIFN